MQAMPSLLPNTKPLLDGEIESFAVWESRLARVGHVIGMILTISVVGIVAIAPGLIVQHYLWRWLPWPITTRRARVAYWLTAIPLYVASAYLMAFYVAPLFVGRYESPYEDAPCAQGGGWFC